MIFGRYFAWVVQTLFGKSNHSLALYTKTEICFSYSLIKTKCFPEAHHHYMVSMQFVWNLIKSVIVIWRGMPDRSLVTYLNAIDFAYKTVPIDLRCEDDLELLGHVLILISGSIKCCDQSTLVLFAETID